MGPEPHRQSHRSTSSALDVAAAVALAVSLLGCSDRDATHGLQPLPSGTSSGPTTTVPTLTPEQQAVADAVTRYDAVIKTISDGAPLDMKKIRNVAVDPWATKAGRSLLVLKAQNQRTSGIYRNTRRSIIVSAERATFLGCSDSHLMKVVTTGKEPKTVAGGADPSIARISLVKRDGKWYVQNFKEENQC
jgi:hypothetical protein